jgi:hypothetical protein
MNRNLPPAVDWSCRLYTRLLAILPGRFRQDYDQPILQAFSDLCLSAWQARGPLGIASVWLQALPDLADGAAGEWRFELVLGGSMERVFVRTSLLMTIVICATLVAILAFPPLPHATRYVAGLLVLTAILSVAVSGWRSRYWQQVTSESSGNDLVAVGSGEAGPSKARFVLLGLESAFLGLFLYVLRYGFLFPAQLSSAAAQRFVLDPNQIGPKRLVGIIILGAYLAVTMYGARGRRPSARPWMVGVTAGGIGGLAVLLLTAAVRLDALLLVMFFAALLAGLIAGRLTGQTEAGALGGFWCGLACALVWAAGGMVVDLTLASSLGGTVWASNHYFCHGLAGSALAACAVGADVSNWGKVLLGLPIISGGLGVIGGLWGAALTKARQPVESDWGRALVAPVVFCGMMVLLFAAGIVGLVR